MISIIMKLIKNFKIENKEIKSTKNVNESQSNIHKERSYSKCSTSTEMFCITDIGQNIGYLSENIHTRCF